MTFSSENRGISPLSIFDTDAYQQFVPLYSPPDLDEDNNNAECCGTGDASPIGIGTFDLLTNESSKTLQQVIPANPRFVNGVSFIQKPMPQKKTLSSHRTRNYFVNIVTDNTQRIKGRGKKQIRKNLETKYEKSKESRQKRKEYMLFLENKVVYYAKEISALQERIAALAQENLLLKNQRGFVDHQTYPTADDTISNIGQTLSIGLSPGSIDFSNGLDSMNLHSYVSDNCCEGYE